jgi:hypothetical protein
MRSRQRPIGFEGDYSCVAETVRTLVEIQPPDRIPMLPTHALCYPVSAVRR